MWAYCSVPPTERSPVTGFDRAMPTIAPRRVSEITLLAISAVPDAKVRLQIAVRVQKTLLRLTGYEERKGLRTRCDNGPQDRFAGIHQIIQRDC
jgi:hypothetical protein